MRTRTLTDLVHFTEETPRTEVLFETGKLWSQVICLQGAQGVGPLADEDADGLLFVLSGEVAAQVGKARARLKQWGTAPIPAGPGLPREPPSTYATKSSIPAAPLHLHTKCLRFLLASR